MTTTPVALVTGATSGIGQATALALADAGFEVIGTGRNTARAATHDGVTLLDLDVSSDESVAPAPPRRARSSRPDTSSTSTSSA
jgi:NAD(P)-dependent dehydrogenase (short-subunit alcohol dehydrogenase family)